MAVCANSIGPEGAAGKTAPFTIAVGTQFRERSPLILAHLLEVAGTVCAWPIAGVLPTASKGEIEDVSLKVNNSHEYLCKNCFSYIDYAVKQEE